MAGCCGNQIELAWWRSAHLFGWTQRGQRISFARSAPNLLRSCGRCRHRPMGTSELPAHVTMFCQTRKIAIYRHSLPCFLDENLMKWNADFSERVSQGIYMKTLTPV